MSITNENQNLVLEMIAFANADGKLKEMELHFIKTVARQLKIDDDTFESLLVRKPKKIIPSTEAERILQFHRLVLLMNVDQEIHAKELKQIHEFGIKMGLSLDAISQVLEEMHNYPNKVVPSAVLLALFKAQHN